MKDTLIGARKLKLVYSTWEPQDAPKALVVLVHGHGDHSGRYNHVIQALTEHGYLVWTMDQRGHGESAGVRAHVEHFDYFVDDLDLLVGKARTAQPDLPLFMLGQSMGGLIATRYALQHRSHLQGLVLSGAALQIGDTVSPTLKRISRLVATIAPRLPIVLSSPTTESVLSRDPLVQEAFDLDPLTYKGRVRARMGYEMLRASIDTRQHGSDLVVPLLVMHGTEDRLTNPQGSVHLYEASQSADKTLKLWDGCRHEIFNEPERDEVIEYTLRWLDHHLMTAA